MDIFLKNWSIYNDLVLCKVSNKLFEQNYEKSVYKRIHRKEILATVTSKTKLFNLKTKSQNSWNINQRLIFNNDNLPTELAFDHSPFISIYAWYIK